MKFQKIIASLILVIAIAFSTGAYAQTNYSDIKVDELSDTQIRQLMKRAESIGYDDAQLEQLAAAQGMNQSEIVKLRARVEKLRTQDEKTNSAADANKTGSAASGGLNKEVSRSRTYKQDTLQGKTLGDEETDEELAKKNEEELKDAFGNLIPKVFGAELFKKSEISFEPNLRMATPKSYVIGPDDKLLIDLSGDNEAEYNLEVSPEGTIRLEYVGTVNVGGLSIEDATSKLKSVMSKTYPALKSGRTKITVNLGNIRSIKVTLLGEVNRPGSYTLSSLSTVFNALSASGGPNTNGSFRKIQVIRNNKVVSTVDVYDFLLNGIQKNNIRLQDQDVINIPVYQTRVEMAGEVKRPALFEVLSIESLEDVIRFAGGFSNKAYTAKIKVLQNTNKERKIADVNADNFNTYNPLNGDKYIVEEILDRFANRVEITGAVFRPGQFELEPGLTLKQLILKADGLKEDAFLTRAYISRLNADNTQALLSFNVANILDGTAQDIVLRREDKVTIPSLFDLRDEYKVDIKGEVRFPGTFDYGDGMTIETLIQQAGGFKEGATPNRIEIARRTKADVNSSTAKTAEVFTLNLSRDFKVVDTAFTLKPFDIVSIRTSEGYQVQQQVKIEGEVVHPGIYTITRKDEKISDILKRAGGLTPLAFTEGASLKRPGPEKDTIENAEKLKLEKEEEIQKLANLKRLQGLKLEANDTLQLAAEDKILGSDLVGIDLTRIVAKPNSRYDLLVEDGDIIRVPRQLQTVKVSGEVLRPNNVIYNAGKSMNSYINSAGGYTTNASKKGAYIQYANGGVEAKRKFLFFSNSPRVKPGSEIFVPKREPRQKLGVQGIIGIGTAVASMAAIIVSILR